MHYDRGQVDLVDFQSLLDGDFKFILHYKEHLTKYSFFRPLKYKKASEIAMELLNIFLTFGAPMFCGPLMVVNSPQD